MYVIPRVVHQDSAVANQPLFDPLIGICNPYADEQAFNIHFFDMNGKEVPKSPLTYTLPPGRSVATTLIKANVFSDPPENFEGYATIEFLNSPIKQAINLPAMCCLGGNGPSPKNWNQSAPSIELFGTGRRTEGPGQRWVFPYVIPYFQDPVQHAGPQEYRAGLSILNMGNVPVDIAIVYTVGETYANAGARLEAQVTIGPWCSLAKQMHELFPGVLTMNPREDGQGFEGSEGWIDITTTQSTPLGIWLDCANRDFDSFGVGQVPWIIA